MKRLLGVTTMHEGLGVGSRILEQGAHQLGWKGARNSQDVEI